MNHSCCLCCNTDFTVEIPKIDIVGQFFPTFPFHIFVDIRLDAFDYPSRRVLTFGELIGSFHHCSIFLLVLSLTAPSQIIVGQGTYQGNKTPVWHVFMKKGLFPQRRWLRRKYYCNESHSSSAASSCLPSSVTELCNSRASFGSVVVKSCSESVFFSTSSVAIFRSIALIFFRMDR